MPPDPIIYDEQDEEDYESSQDSDFAPDDDIVVAPGDSEADDSEDDGGDAATTTNKRKGNAATGDEADDAGFENSGDEALIKKANNKKRKKAKDGGVDGTLNEEDEGGEGGLVKTRSMRAAEKAERKTTAVSGLVTVDVDAIWAQMLAGQTAPQQTSKDDKPAAEDHELYDSSTKTHGSQKAAESPTSEPSDTIRIKRTYNFAGKVQTEEKVVARDSAEARLYLASIGGKEASVDASAGAVEPEKPRLVLKKAFRSAFEPEIEVVGQRSDLNLGMMVRIKAREREEAQAQVKKLNTVEKSKMDWAGFVDQEGLKDELELAGRSKDSYAHRQDFLARSEAKREEEARRARIAGRA